MARLIIGSSEREADLFYATRFLAPDSFVYLETPGEKLLLMSDLEFDRAREQARVDSVLSLSRYQDRARASGVENPGSLDALVHLLREREIPILEVPRSFPLESGDKLRAAGFEITFPEGSFFPDRELKSPEEVEHIGAVQRVAEEAMDGAITVIREAEVLDGVLYSNGEILTSESVKRKISSHLMDRNCSARHTIVACGDQACDPHNEGSGPLEAGHTIILDIFPRSDETGYFGDITRTVVKGHPTDDMLGIYSAVLDGQKRALAGVAAGVDGEEIHREVTDLFESRGYVTGEVDGRLQGYFHGTGHGVGLEIHEPPRISKATNKLQAGHVVTIEPGLYYLGRGAVRIEDLVVVTEEGCDNLTSYPKEFQV